MAKKTQNTVPELHKLEGHVRRDDFSFHGDWLCIGFEKKFSKKIQSASNHYGSTSFIYDVFLCLPQSHKMAWPFLEPVNADEVPEYYDVITDPIGESPKRRWVCYFFV